MLRKFGVKNTEEHGDDLTDSEYEEGEDSNGDYQDYSMTESKHQEASEHRTGEDSNNSEVRTIVRHHIQNTEVTHPPGKNVINKIFDTRRDKTKLFQNDTSTAAATETIFEIHRPVTITNEENDDEPHHDQPIKDQQKESIQRLFEVKAEENDTISNHQKETSKTAVENIFKTDRLNLFHNKSLNEQLVNGEIEKVVVRHQPKENERHERVSQKEITNQKHSKLGNEKLKGTDITYGVDYVRESGVDYQDNDLEEELMAEDFEVESDVESQSNVKNYYNDYFKPQTENKVENGMSQKSFEPSKFANDNVQHSNVQSSQASHEMVQHFGQFSNVEPPKFPDDNSDYHQQPNMDRNHEEHLQGQSNFDHNFQQSKFSSGDNGHNFQQSRFAGTDHDQNFQKSRFASTDVDQHFEVNTDWVVENNLNFSIVEHTQACI